MFPSPFPSLIEQADRLINAKAFDALMNCYTNDAVLVVKPGSCATGRDAIRRAFEAIAAHFHGDLEVRQLDLREIVAGDVALIMAKTSIRSGEAEWVRHATYVYRRGEDGHWRCAVDNSYGTDLLDSPPKVDARAEASR